jgi:hypothetical protein
VHQELLPADNLADGERNMGTDAHTPKSRAGQAFEVIHHPDERFYELLVDGQFAGLVAHEDAGGRYVFTHTFIAEGFPSDWPVPGRHPCARNGVARDPRRGRSRSARPIKMTEQGTRRASSRGSGMLVLARLVLYFSP